MARFDHIFIIYNRILLEGPLLKMNKDKYRTKFIIFINLNYYSFLCSQKQKYTFELLIKTYKCALGL